MFTMHEQRLEFCDPQRATRNAQRRLLPPLEGTSRGAVGKGTCAPRFGDRREAQDGALKSSMGLMGRNEDEGDIVQDARDGLRRSGRCFDEWMGVAPVGEIDATDRTSQSVRRQ